MSKPKIIVSFDNLDENLKQRIKLNYPTGFEKHLITFKNHKKHLISALPYETLDKHYLVKMSREKASEIISNDDDYNGNGLLKVKIQEAYEEKFANLSLEVEKVTEAEASKDGK